MTPGCILWTNPVTGTEIHVHTVVTDDAETDLTCCNQNTTPGCDPLFPDCCACYCPCQDINTPDTFRECLSSKYTNHAKNCHQILLASGPLAERKLLTQDSVANNDLGFLHTSNLLRAMTSLKAANGGSLGYVATYHGDAPGPCGASICCPHGSSLEFLPWHRLYTVQMDTEVRTQNTGVTSSTPAQPFTPATLPYWDWTTNSAGTGPMTALPDLVSTPMIMDPISGTLITNPFFTGFIPGVGSNTVRNPLPFLFAHPTTTLKQRVLDALGEPTFALFSELLVVPHNEVHIWTGGFPPGAPVVGSMADTEFAPMTLSSTSIIT